jgi:membrane protein YqaA with SNARE-associated domain
MSDLWNALESRLHEILAWVEAFAQTPYGGTALFVIAFAESSFFPVPPDVLLIALCLGEPTSALWFAAICTVGSVLGGAFGYGVGRYGGRPLLLKWFGEARIAPVERYYERWNAWATGIGGLTPIPYKIFTIAGGVFAVRFGVFLVASLLARGLRFFTIAILIYLYGDSIREFIDHHLGWLSVAFVILLVLGFWIVGRGLNRAGQDASPQIDEEG